MAGDPQCARVPRPFRQAPTQQGGRDNHAAPDSTHGDGGIHGGEGTQREGASVGEKEGGVAAEQKSAEEKKVEDVTRRRGSGGAENRQEERQMNGDGWRGRET